MDKYNLTNAFSKTPEGFHKKVEETLLALPEEKESNEMKEKISLKKRISWKKAVIIAAAAVLAVGTTAFAAGKIVTGTSRLSARPTYWVVPDEAEIEKVLGVPGRTINAFKNDYHFFNGNVIESSGQDETGNTVVEFKQLSLQYITDRKLLFLNLRPHFEERGPIYEELLVENYKDISIYYDSQIYKNIAEDYVMTKQDKADEASGKYVFSRGFEHGSPLIQQVQNVLWTDGDVDYQMVAIDSELTKEELVAMAKEIIGAE